MILSPRHTSMLIAAVFSVLVFAGERSRKPTAVVVTRAKGQTTPAVAYHAAKPPQGCERYENEVSTLGTGLVRMPDTFVLHNNSNLLDKPDLYYLYQTSGSHINACPKFCKPDYGIMYYVCVELTATYYKVLINYDEYRYVPKTSGYIFKPWSHYIFDAYGISRLGSQSLGAWAFQPLRKFPRETSDTLSIPAGDEAFCPLEIKGDWIKVTYDCFHNLKNNPHALAPCVNFIKKCRQPLTGWLRWRNKNKLLINVLVLC